MSEYEQFKADPRFTPSTGTILADKRIAYLEAENQLLRTALAAIQSTTPGSAHRIAMQALSEGGTPSQT